MAKVMAMTYRAVSAWLSRWLWVSAVIACMGQRLVALWALRVWSTWLTSIGRPPAMRQQFLESAVRQRGQPREHVLEVGPGISSVELGRLQQAHHDRGSLAGQLTADEEPGFSTHRPRPHLVFEVVVVDRHLTVEQELRQRLPVVQAVVDRLGDGASVGHPHALELEPQVQFLPQRLGSLLSHQQPMLGAQWARVGLDPVQPGDTLDGLRGHFACVGLDQFVEFTPGMRNTTLA